jgi:hypothetical protein
MKEIRIFFWGKLTDIACKYHLEKLHKYTWIKWYKPYKEKCDRNFEKYKLKEWK